MKFVSEELVNQTIEELSADPELYGMCVQSLLQEQPNIIAYFFQEDFSLLTEAEHEYLLYLLIVIWKSIQKEEPSAGRLSQNAIGRMDEQNWEQLKDVKKGKFRERVDPFFVDYPQEDLLAFVEDALVHDEEEEERKVSNEGREYLFVALKSIIDAFHQLPALQN
ncbi:MAG: hypothetical protein AAFV95_11140 [Bacteroidota bacterium]